MNWLYFVAGGAERGGFVVDFLTTKHLELFCLVPEVGGPSEASHHHKVGGFLQSILGCFQSGKGPSYPPVHF